MNYELMDYKEAMCYMQNLTKFGFNFGLARIEELMKRLGNPHTKLKIVHIGGTNGKGSTSSILKSILVASGYKVGLFSSPHLHSYTERYRIDGQQISEARIAQLISEIKPHLEAMVKEGFEHPTEFEVSTALCFKYFFEEQVDLLVLEVGLGGAIDSTNVIEKSLVSVITNVGMDHMEYLGNSVQEIAAVKAGIIKPNGLVVTASGKEEVLSVIKETCRQQKAKLYTVGEDTSFKLLEGNMEGNCFNYYGLEGNEYKALYMPLLGEYQVLNSVTALTVAELLTEQGYQISETTLREGLKKSKWAARMEIMQQEPLVIIDGAHNLDGAIELRKAVQKYLEYDNLILVIGMLADKEREKVVAELVPLAREIIVTKPNNPRAGEWQQLAEEVAKLNSNVTVISDIAEAVKTGLTRAEAGDLVCITGSLYMVAEAREYWTKNA